MASTASSALPDLQLGSDQLIDFLKAELETLENDLGGPDAEARGLLDMLQRQTRLIQHMSGEDGVGGSAVALTDLEIAQQIDSLDEQLSQLEASLSSADKPTMQLLGQSTDRWLNPEQSQQQAASIPTKEHPAAAVAAAGQEQPGGDSASNDNSSSCSQEQVGPSVECVTGAVDKGVSDSEGSVVEEQAALPSGAQQVDRSSTAAEAAVAESDAATAGSVSFF